MLTQVIAHRGSKGVRPENTLAAFKKAIEEGADGIETDVHLSKDGEMVIIHDETVDRTTNGTGRVFDHTLAELKQLSAGGSFSGRYQNEKIPTLQEVVDLLIAERYTGTFNLELKTDKFKYPGIEQKVFSFFKDLDYPFELVYSSFNPETLVTMHTLQPDVEMASLFKFNAKAARKLTHRKVIQNWHPSMAWVRGHRFLLGKRRLRPWTINVESDLRFCFQKGFLGVITDYPTRALQVRATIQGG